VPALYLDEGVEIVGRPEGWGAERENEWVETLYHQPGDEVTPEWDLSGQVEVTRLLYRVGYAVAQTPEPPSWSPGDEFAAAREDCPSP
jgi:hypothetical protein